jgi:hypothetical protein
VNQLEILAILTEAILQEPNKVLQIDLLEASKEAHLQEQEVPDKLEN